MASHFGEGHVISIEDDKLHEECGVFGIWGDDLAAYKTYLGLFALQHRGQETAGIISHDGEKFNTVKNKGEVSAVFDKEGSQHLKGNRAIGHVRYGTAGDSSERNAQPLLVESWRGGVALGHNGNLENTKELREQLWKAGSIFQTTSDTECILHLLVKSEEVNFDDALVDALTQVKGAYSMVILAPDRLMAVRDPYGVRPLALGKLDHAYVVASETCAFDLIGAEYVREVEPGEFLTISENGLHSRFPFKPVTTRPCIFEHVYFARPDSKVFGRSVQEMRKAFGRQLARETGVDADVVIPVPDSGVFAAMGFAEESGIPYDMGIIRNHYVGRTFIQPGQEEREFKVKVKLNPVREIIENRRIVVVDDSIVRGTTSKAIAKILFETGAKEVHFRVSSPPTSWSCVYGIDTPDRKKLIAANHTVPEIEEFLGVTTLGYISLEGMLSVARKTPGETFCTACWDGNYQVNYARSNDDQMELSFSGK